MNAHKTQKTKPVLIVSLGADALAPPGTSIVGGQAVFTRALAEHLAEITSTTLMTLSFEGVEHKGLIDSVNVKLIPLPGKEYDALGLWKQYSEIEAIAGKTIDSLASFKGLVVSVYWLSGLLLLHRGACLESHWGHSFASFSVQKRVSHLGQTNQYPLYFRHRSIIERRIALTANFVWTTCKHEADILQQSFGVETTRCTWLPRAIDTDIFYPVHNIKQEKVWDLVFLGRLDHRKGIYDIPLILNHLPSRRRIKAAIVGGTDNECAQYARWFRSNATEHFRTHNIKFIPALSRQEVADLLRSSRILLIPSHYENFGNVALEGLACGVPVVASMVGGLPELVSHGVNGFLFPSGDFKLAANFIEHLLSSPQIYAEMTSRLRNGIPSEFTWPHLMQKIRRLL